jgi:hypothetical protein
MGGVATGDSGGELRHISNGLDKNKCMNKSHDNRHRKKSERLDTKGKGNNFLI